ncbi:MAG: carboxymuconolactone decarboxylase family protein [Ilumatobacter sp.]|uniref:carboxymuconolactone decarboxylase family protein n=1 Tax=Ilumatobacter sp. TaxID=1967498 RepID=UPI003C76F5A8
MSQRVDMMQLAPDSYKAVFALQQHVQSKLPTDLLELVKLRASMVNSCVFCIDMHSTDALEAGEDGRRLFAVAAWEESPWFTPRERAAFALTDAITRLDGGVNQEVWDTAIDTFGEAQTVELVFAIATINVWNRLAISTHMTPPPLAS